MTYFSELGLAEPILRALGAKGYADPTPIQRKAIPALLEGRDLLGIAQTGTGKTAAFALPSLHRLANDPQPRRNAGCRMLVLSPTRELAAQIADNMRGYARFLNLSVQCVFGGVPAGKQARALERGCDVLVATPGRLLDLIDSRALTLRHVEIFVLDEADQMMDLGFIVPLKRIAAMLPKQRQSLFFSATMPQAIAELGRQFINDPVKVEVAPQATTAERVEQFVTFCNQAEKQALLSLSLRAGLAEGAEDPIDAHDKIDRALVFTRTKHGADRVVRFLTTAGVPAAAIHGNKSQAQRTAALGGFRSGSVRVLVATDIAARGIDVSGVSHVFNFELPNVPEQYVHRIGRTARAGADGVAVSYCAPDEKAYLRDIERLTRVKLAPLPLPEDFQKQAARLPAPSKKQAGINGAVSTAAGERRGPGRSGGQRGEGQRGGGQRGSGQRGEGQGLHRDEHRNRAPQHASRDGGERRRDDRAQDERPRGNWQRDDRARDERPYNENRRNENPRNENRRPEGQRGNGQRGNGQHGQGRDGQHRDGQHRDGQRRDGQHREGQRRDGPRGDAPRNHEDNGQQPKRRFRPKGPRTMGAHKNAVRRTG